MAALNATATVVEERREPVDKAENHPQTVVTGQWLYDNFVVADEAQITRMGLIRQLSDTADALQIKGACDKMVEKAKEVDIANGVPEKITKAGKERANRGPKAQHAMNVRTIIQQAWGALKFARDNLNSLGYNDKTGWQDMRVLAKRALDAKRIKWTGEGQLTERDRERRALLQQQKGETDALLDTIKNNPREVGETIEAYNARMAELARDKVEEAREAAISGLVEKIVVELAAKHDENTLYRIAEGLLDHIGIAINQSSDSAEAPVDDETAHAEETPAEAPVEAKKPSRRRTRRTPADGVRETALAE